MKKTPQEIADKLIINQIEMERFGEGTRQKVLSLLDATQKEIIAELAANDPLNPSLTQWREQRLRAVQTKISQIVDKTYADIKSESSKAGKEIAEFTLRSTPELLNDILGADLFGVNYTPELLKNIAAKTMVDGHIIGAWWDKQGQDTKDKIIGQMNKVSEELSIGLIKGEALGELISRIRGTALTPGVMSIPKHQAAALARTSTMQVLQATRMEVYKQNEDVLKGYQVCATLDARTTPICRALDGREYDLSFKPLGHSMAIPPGPPFHWNCRSTLIPLTKTYAELAGPNSKLSQAQLKELNSIPQTVRASMGGPVDGKLDYGSWLLSQSENIQKDILGPKRWQLWKDNKLTMADMVHQNGRPLTIAELYDRINNPMPVEIAEPAAIPIPQKISILSDISGLADLTDRTNEGVTKKLQEIGIQKVFIPKGRLDVALAITDDLVRMYQDNPNILTYTRKMPIRKLDFKNKAMLSNHGTVGQYNLYSRKITVVATRGIEEQAPKLGVFSATGSTQQIVRHEFAHNIFNMAKLKSSAVGDGLKWEQIFAKYPKKWWEANLTKYSATNEAEAFCEAFAVFTNSKYQQGLLPKDIENYFEILLRSDKIKFKMGPGFSVVEKGKAPEVAFLMEGPQVFKKRMEITGFEPADAPKYPGEKQALGEPKEFKQPKYPTKEGGMKWQSAGAVVVEEDGSVWLYQPKGQYAGYKATFPKGTIEQGMTAQQTAIKEIFEETGLQVDIVGYLGDYEKTSSVTRYYIAKRVGGSPVAFAAEETDSVILTPQSQLKGFLNVKMDKKIADDFLVRYQEFVNLGEGDIVKGAKLWAVEAEKKYATEEFVNVAASQEAANLFARKPDLMKMLYDEPDIFVKLKKAKDLLNEAGAKELVWKKQIDDFIISKGDVADFLAKNPNIKTTYMNLSNQEAKYKYLTVEYDKAINNTASLAGEGKKYDLTDPLQKAQYEKTKYMYLNKYKNAVIAGNEPTAAQKALWKSLAPEEKDLWQLKIDKGMGKLVEPEIKTLFGKPYDMGIPSEKKLYDEINKGYESKLKEMLAEEKIKTMFNLHPEYIPEVAGQINPAEKLVKLQDYLKIFTKEQTEWNEKFVELLSKQSLIKMENIKDNLASIPDWQSKYGYLQRKIAEAEAAKPKIVVLGGKKEYNLDIPEEKAQYEKVKYMYLNKYKNAIVAGQNPTPAQKALWQSLSADEKELWQFKIDKGLGKTGQTPPPKPPEVADPLRKVLGKEPDTVSSKLSVKELDKIALGLSDAAAKKKMEDVLFYLDDFGIPMDITTAEDALQYWASYQKGLSAMLDMFEPEGDNYNRDMFDILSKVIRMAPEAETPAVRAQASKGVLNFNNMVKYAGQEGSNTGGYYHVSDNPAERYYIKFPNNEEIARNEMLAGKLYKAAGVEVPELQLIEANGTTGIASRIVEGNLSKLDMELVKKGLIKGVGDNFVVDAWLGDWDVVGLNYDNLLQVEGKAVRIDVGGSLRFRAQGGIKGQEFGKDVVELETMLDGRRNKQAAAVFKNVKKGELEIGARKVLSISDDTIRELVAEYGPRNKKEADDLAEILIARKQDIAKKFPHINVDELGENIGIPKDVTAIITKADQKNIINSRAGGYSLKVDKEDIEDHNVLFWVERNKANDPFTGSTFKVRGEATNKLDALISTTAKTQPVGPSKQVIATGEAHTDSVTTIKGILSNNAGKMEDLVLRAKDIDRAKVAYKTIEKLLGDLGRATTEGKIKSEDMIAFAKHYDPWLKWFNDIAKKSDGDIISMPAELQGKQLTKFKDIDIIIKKAKEVKPVEQEFKLTKRSQNYEQKEIDKGHLRVTNSNYSFTDYYYEGTMPDGTRIRYWNKEASFANVGKVEILTPGEGVTSSAKIIDVMKKLGLTTDHTDIDDEILYLKQCLYHMKHDPETVAGEGQELLYKLRKAYEKAAGKPISKMKNYDYAGTKEAFGQGNVLRWRADLEGDTKFEKFRQEYVLHHNLYRSTPDAINDILNSGGKLLATTNKLRVGIYPSGMSPDSDMGTGGASYVFTRIKKSTTRTPGLVWDADLLRRLDSISYSGDKFGKVVPGFVQPNRKTGVQSWEACANHSSNETIFKNSISIFDKLKRIICESQSEREQVIKIFRNHGYNTFPDGRRLVDVIVTE